jgi:hypothetical protein
MNNLKVNAVRVYAAGGLGLNVVNGHLSNVENKEGSVIDGFASAAPVYLDTSRGNHEENMGGNFYHFRSAVAVNNAYANLEGGGKDRQRVAKSVDHWVDHALECHPAMDFNIVVHSLTGASGSVIGPLLVKRLLKQNKSVIVLAALSDTSLQEINNAKSTISTYESIAKIANTPIVIKTYLGDNQEKTDELIISDLSHLRGLFSGVNQAMDAMDLKNWLNYRGKSASMEHRLYTLDIYGGKRLMTEPAISVAALASSNNVPPPVPVAYYTTGIPPQTWFEGDIKMIEDKPLYFAISDGAHVVYDTIDEIEREAVGRFVSPRSVKNAIDTSFADGDTGIVF